jgi:hypothetical protein
MTEPSESFLRDLRSEARNLEYLLKNYLEDKSFVVQEPGRRLLYFIDSHELRAYITPNDPEHLNGFMLLPERSRKKRLRGAEATDFEFEIKLKSERFIHALLFERKRQTVLLPSHGEEIDEVIAFQRRKGFRDRISLLDDARLQLRRLMAKVGTTGKDLQRAESDPKRKQYIVEFIRNAAPALMALLRPNPDTSMSRVDALIRTSNLVPLNQVAWHTFGYDAAECEYLRALRPAQSKLDDWRKRLAERPDHTYRSNRIDAEALAYLQELNAEFERLAANGPRVRALLVTRAMALIRTARVHGNAEFVRHPRLLVLPGTTASTLSDQPDQGGQRPEQALRVALQTYQQQLKALIREPKEASEAALKRAVDALLDAWHEFERARLTIELRSQPEPSSITEDEAVDADYRCLLHWLREDADVENLIKDELVSAIRQFGRETFVLGKGSDTEPVNAHVVPLSDPVCSRVVPMVSGAPLPVEFLAAGLHRPEPRYLDIFQVLSDLEASAAERYVAWSLLFACQRRWSLADIYANSALDVAKLGLVPPREAEWVRHEAQLLRAQISRLGQTREPTARFRWSEKALSRTVRLRDPRIPFERAAQLLESRLKLPEETSDCPSLAVGFKLINAARELARNDDLMFSRVLALGICYYVAACAHPGLWPELTPENRATLQEWHGELHKLLKAKGTGTRREEISVRARAVEIIGFQCFVSPDVESTFVQGSRIPSALHLDVFEIRERMASSTDAIAKLIAEGIEQFARRLEIYRPRDLIYAPVWASNEEERVIDLIPAGETRARVRSFYEQIRAIAGASQRVGVLPHHRDELERLAASFAGASKILSGRASDPRVREAVFHLSMESCYARLLLTRMPNQNEDRENLAQEYRRLAAEFPHASVPHFRLDALLSELDGCDEEALEHARIALKLVNTDPFIRTPRHWVKSTMRRRVAWRYAERAEKIRDKFGTRDANEPALLREYMDNLKHAFDLIYAGYPEEVSSREDIFYEIEARRRINNIVYYGSQILEQPDGADRLQGAGFGMDELREMIKLLHPGGINNVVETNIAHTIGYAYNLLGEVGEATVAAQRVFTLVGETGGDPTKDKGLARVMGDAIRWMHRRTDESLSVGARTPEPVAV